MSILVDVNANRGRNAHQSQHKPQNQFVYDVVKAALEEDENINSVEDVAVKSIRLTRDSEYDHANEKEIATGKVTTRYTDRRGELIDEEVEYEIYAGKKDAEFVYNEVEVNLQ